MTETDTLVGLLVCFLFSTALGYGLLAVMEWMNV